MAAVNSVQQCLDGFPLCSRHHAQHDRHRDKSHSQSLSALGIEPRQITKNMNVEREIQTKLSVLDRTISHLSLYVANTSALFGTEFDLKNRNFMQENLQIV